MQAEERKKGKDFVFLEDSKDAVFQSDQNKHNFASLNPKAGEGAALGRKETICTD